MRATDNIDRAFEERVLELLTKGKRGTIMADYVMPHPRPTPRLKLEVVSKRDMQLPRGDR